MKLHSLQSETHSNRPKELRRKILHEGSGQLTYEIREIVRLAHQIEAMGQPITWENIGDPIRKGEQLPEWIKNIVQSLIQDNATYAYSSTAGNPETRQFLADLANERGGCPIIKDDIIFFNGLGDAVSKIFGYLKKEARVIGPSPAYSTHSSAEAAHSGYKHVTYTLDPANNWMPDLNDLEMKAKYNDSVAGILLINPHNPTGAVCPVNVLEEVVRIARRYRLFIICDEIYANIIYSGADTAALSQVIGNVPGMALRGISKEYPWPGSRCGWIEAYNRHRYPAFEKYIQTLLNAKMLEVSSTSLPQLSIPKVMADPRYAAHLEKRRAAYEWRAQEVCDIFNAVQGIHVIEPRGAFYATVLFEEGILNNRQFLAIDNAHVKKHIEDRIEGLSPDKRFVYYLLGATGICVVPLSGFASLKNGFRITLLEANDQKRLRTWKRLINHIEWYLQSA